MLPDLRVGVVERHPEALLRQLGRELAVRHRRHQELRVLRLEDVVQFLQGPGPEGRVKIAHAQGPPDLQTLFMAGPDDDVVHLLVGIEAVPEQIRGNVPWRLGPVTDMPQVGIHLGSLHHPHAGVQEVVVGLDVVDEAHVRLHLAPVQVAVRLDGGGVVVEDPPLLLRPALRGGVRGLGRVAAGEGSPQERQEETVSLHAGRLHRVSGTGWNRGRRPSGPRASAPSCRRGISRRSLPSRRRSGGSRRR